MEFLFADFHKITTVVKDLAALFDGVAREYAHDGAVGDGLTRAALADDSERFALIKVERNVAHRLHVAVRGTERNLKVVYGKFFLLLLHN